MKVLLFGEKSDKIKNVVNDTDLKIVSDNYDAVISYGGDGTFLRSEHAYPGVPKIVLNDSRICKLCSKKYDNKEVLVRVAKRMYKKRLLTKLSLKVNNKKLIAVNDVIIHNHDPRHAIRYDLSIDGRLVVENIIGDGIVVATPLGSTGYYRSITDSFFEVGIGLAFNNSTEQSDHMVIKEASVITFKVVRGPAVVYADNQKKNIVLNNGDVATVQKATDTACLLEVV